MSRRTAYDEDVGFNNNNNLKNNPNNNFNNRVLTNNSTGGAIAGRQNLAVYRNEQSPFLLSSAPNFEEDLDCEDENGFCKEEGLSTKLKSLISNEGMISFADGLHIDDGCQQSSSNGSKNFQKAAAQRKAVGNSLASSLSSSLSSSSAGKKNSSKAKKVQSSILGAMGH